MQHSRRHDRDLDAVEVRGNLASSVPATASLCPASGRPPESLEAGPTEPQVIQIHTGCDDALVSWPRVHASLVRFSIAGLRYSLDDTTGDAEISPLPHPPLIALDA